ncbi:hemagglutinin repeat-containing protein [Burkholderia sp. F1]|uniref:two-partner secretion domain-containing protein n=1 Tax=Burkholderia sp. F1 TaxID=3366817 RepID=UPI003D719FA3
MTETNGGFTPPEKLEDQLLLLIAGGEPMSEHPMKSCRLSASGKLSVLVGLAIWSMNAAHAQNIVPVGNTGVSQHNGVDVVNIVAPNAGGLSLNQYNKFNVGTQGAVLNNSTVAGQSQLAGKLAANAQLQGQAAKVILNEVVSKNPSLLLGKQEVFGMAADYVLANPNGITCSGCGFINTPRASLVVGTPELANGSLAGFAVGANGGNNGLAVSGNVSGAAVLDLIAPKVDVNGNLQASDSVNVIAGRQHVDYAGRGRHDLTANEKAAASSIPVLDGSVVGSISAGTIRIYNSDPQASTSVHANLDAGQGIDMQAAGNVSITASRIDAPQIAVAANNLAIQGQVQGVDATTAPSSSGSWFGGTHTTSGASHTETFTATQIHGGDVSLNAAGKANLNAVQIDARNVNVTAGSVALDNTVTTRTASSTDRQGKIFWSNLTRQDQQVQTLYGNNWHADQDIGIHATRGAASVNAAAIAAGGSVAIDGSQRVTLGGTVTRNGAVTTNRYVNETAALKTGQQVTSGTEQTYHGTTIQAGNNVSIGSAADVSLLGAQVDAAQVAVASHGTTTIGAQSSQNVQSQQQNFVYWGGIGGGETHGTRTTATTQHGSAINARNVSVQGDGGVSVVGSTLSGSSGVQLASANGGVSIGHVFNHTETLQNDRHGTAFNITDKSHTSQSDSDTTVASAIASQGAIQVNSAKDISLTGSSVKAGGALNVHAAGTIRSDIADAQTSTTTQDFTLGTVPNVQHSMSGTTLNVTAGIGLQGVTHTVGQGSGVATASTLSGGTVTLQGDTAIDLKGSRISATAGDVKLAGRTVSVGAGDSKVTSNFDDTNVTGAGVYVSGQLTNVDTSSIASFVDGIGKIGVAQVGIGAHAGTQQTHARNEAHQAIVSTVHASGNVTMQADQTLRNTGTVVTTPGTISLTARDVVNDAAANTATSTVVSGDGKVTFAANAMLSAPLTAELGVDGQGAASTAVNTTAVVSKLSGGQINVNGRSVTDVGTQYAAAGDVNIHAGTYAGNAAENSQVTTVRTGSAGAKVSASTVTFQDFTVQASANGAYQYQQTGNAKAVLGNINAQNVTIRADNTLASAMNIAAADHVTLAAGQDVTVAQASNRQWQVQAGVSAGGSLGATAVPAAGVIVPSSFSVNGGVNYQNARDSQAVAASVSGKSIAISAGNSAVVQGATLKGDDVTMQAAKVAFDAGYDHHDAFGIGTKGNVSVTLLPGAGGASIGGGTLGAGVTVVSESASQAHGGSIVASNVSLIGDSRDQDLAVVGAGIKADNLTIRNQSGNVSVIAAKGETHKANWNVGGGGTAGSNDKRQVSLGANAQVGVDGENSTTYQVGKINAGTVNLAAGQDIALQTNLQAGVLTGQAGGNVSVSSAQNRKDTFRFSFAASANDVPIPAGQTTATDVIKTIGNAVAKDGAAALNPKGNVALTLDNTASTQVSTVHAGQMNVTAGGGRVTINAANLSSDGGAGIGGAAVTTTSNHDSAYHVDFSGAASALPGAPVSGSSANGNPLQWPISGNVNVNAKDTEINASVGLK